MTDLDQLPTTDSGHILKQQAIEWLDNLEEASEEQMRESVVPKPSEFSGSKYATDISDVRITGDPEFVEAVGSLFKVLTDFEDDETRLEVNLQQTEDRNTGEMTDNYALYLSIAERS